MKNIQKISAGLAVAGLLAITGVAYAATGHGAHGPFTRPLVGTVSALGTGSFSMVVQASSTAAVTTYTVETGNAKILKAGTTTLASSIQVNDKVAVIGTVSGTTVTAKTVIDGIVPRTTGPPTAHKGGRTGSISGHSFASSTRPFVRPAAFGSVSAIGQGSFSLAEHSKTGTTTFAIDTNTLTTYREGMPAHAGHAGTTTASFSTLAVGNLVAVTGTTTGTDEILASKVSILPKMNFGKGKLGGWSGHFKGKKTATSTPE